MRLRPRGVRGERHYGRESEQRRGDGGETPCGALDADVGQRARGLPRAAARGLLRRHGSAPRVVAQLRGSLGVPQRGGGEEPRAAADVAERRVERPPGRVHGLLPARCPDAARPRGRRATGKRATRSASQRSGRALARLRQRAYARRRPLGHDRP